MEVNVVTIENGREYIVIDVITNNLGNYLVLSNKDNSKDVCIRKVVKEDKKEFITKLESEEEFNEVIQQFYFRHKRKGDNNEK